MSTPQSSRKTLDKAMQLLMAFSPERTELAVTDLAHILGMHKSVVSRLASSLRSWGMLEQNPVSGRLRIGPTAFRVGTLFSQRNRLAELGMPLLADLVHRTGQSAHLSMLDGLRILVIATVESPNALRVIMRVGEHRHLHATAAGKLFLALSPPDLMNEAYRSTRFGALSPHTITKPEDMIRAFPRIRRELLAFNRGESHVGIGAVAAAVCAPSGEMVAAVSTVFPLNVVDAEQRELIEKQTTRCAQALTRKYFRSGRYGRPI